MNLASGRGKGALAWGVAKDAEAEKKGAVLIFRRDINRKSTAIEHQNDEGQREGIAKG